MPDIQFGNPVDTRDRHHILIMQTMSRIDLKTVPDTFRHAFAYPVQLIFL